MSWEVWTMRSVTSCFNAMLFRKNLTRFWPLWTMASLLAVLPPLALATALVRGYGDKNPLSLTETYYEALCGPVPVVVLFYAVLCALAGQNQVLCAIKAELDEVLALLEQQKTEPADRGGSP